MTFEFQKTLFNEKFEQLGQRLISFESDQLELWKQNLRELSQQSFEGCMSSFQNYNITHTKDMTYTKFYGMIGKYNKKKKESEANLKDPENYQDEPIDNTNSST